MANKEATKAFSQAQSDVASIAQAGGSEGFVRKNVAMVRGKVAGEMETLSHFDSVDQYIQSQRKVAGTKATADRTRLDIDNNQSLADNVVNRVVETAGKGYFGETKRKKTQEAINQLKEVGALQTDENGHVLRNADGTLKATTGIAFSNAFASLGALDMERGKQFMVAGTSMTMDRGRGGEVRITATSVDGTTRGESIDYKASGMLGDWGAALLYGGGTLLAADRAVKAASPTKRGIFERIYGDGTQKGSALNHSVNKSSNPSNAQNNNHNNNNFHGKSNFHNNTPSSDSNIHNYNTKEEFTQAKKDVHAMSPEQAAKKAVYNSLHEAGEQFEKNSPQRTAIAQMMSDLKNGRPIDAARFTELTGKEVPSGKGGAINMHSLGETVKAADNAKINAAEHAKMHPTPEAKANMVVVYGLH